MKTRYFALLMGIVFLAAGVLGFIPALRTEGVDMPPLQIPDHYGLLLGLFPVNILHNAVHILFGIWGVLAYRSFGAARGFAIVVALSYALLTVLGLIPGTETLWGFVPIYGHDVWLHAAIAVVAAIFASMRSPRPVAADYGLRR